jgi:aminomethyltransferase
LARQTVLHANHQALGARIVDFHGWLLPVQYEGVLAEHTHCRHHACLFDTCHMGQLLITGPAAAEALGRVISQDVPGLKIGQCKYGFVLNESGGILDDCIVCRLDADELFLVVNAATQDDDLAWLRDHLPGDVAVEHLTAWGKIDLQGPESFEVLAGHVEGELRELGYFRGRRDRVIGAQCILSRTGYTGELGYEIFLPAERASELFDTLLGDERVKPAGLGARDSLRLEMCYPLSGSDIGPWVDPISADCGFFLPADGEYVGSRALEKIARVGPERKLVAFRSDTRRRANPDEVIALGDQSIGEVTSGAFSPSLGVSIGMGYVRADLAATGTELTVRTRRAELAVTVADKPLYRDGTCRRKL